jgi:DNA-binding transcriptional LysR family regulator
LLGYSIILHSEVDQGRVNSQDYDLCLGFERPVGLSTIVRRIASLHFIMYASAKYIERYGEPRSLNDAAQHRLVIQSAPELLQNVPQLFVGEETARQVTTAQVNSSYALYRAIVDGVGVGAMPSYASTLSRQLFPLDLPVQLKFDLWLSYDQSRRKSAPLRTLIGWLEECFDAEANPWFSERFIHPSAFPEAAAAPMREHDSWNDLYLDAGSR